ncbi:MAG: hypothetical protein JST55_07070 [Bacteroidetes bacterium]|nr:hypothetical protein [Bacteroidota bacterium]
MKKLLSILIVFTFAVIIVSGCSKSDDTTITNTGGNQLPTSPSSPIPSNGAVGVTGFVTATWSCSDPDVNDTLRYDVYIGSTTNPSTVVTTGTLNKAADLGIAGPNTLVYWKVVAKDNHGGVTNGPVWSYRTAP